MVDEEDSAKYLKEILKWIKVTSIPKVKDLLTGILPEDKHKIAYHYSEELSSTQTAVLIGVSSQTVRNWGETWVKAGIAEVEGVRGGERAVRTFSLEDFGIGVPLPENVTPKGEQPSFEEGEPEESQVEEETHE